MKQDYRHGVRVTSKYREHNSIKLLLIAEVTTQPLIVYQIYPDMKDANLVVELIKRKRSSRILY